MEQETLFTASKWEILKLLEHEPLSPIELASLSRTSVANVSQQLRLLEMAGLVESRRVPNRDKGQPRVLYSLAGNSCYVISTANNFVDKKLHAMSYYNKIILKIWFHPDQAEHYFLEKGFWQIDHLLQKLDALGVQITENGINYLLITEQKLPELSPVTLTNPEGESRQVRFTTTTAEHIPEEVFGLFDPKNIFG